MAALAAAAFGCMSPTLPLPPPDAPNETPGSTPGTIHLIGAPNSAEPNAILLIRNNYPNPAENLSLEQQIHSTLVATDGSWDATVYAVPGDVLTIWQEFGKNDASPSIDFQVK